MPAMPLAAAGARIDPPVSLPVAAKQSPAAIAAPEPPLEPEGMWIRFHGFLVGWRIETEREFVRRHLAENDGAGFPTPVGDDR